MNSTSIDFEPYIWCGIAVASGLFIVMTFVFNHHWKYYGIDVSRRTYIQTIYVVGAVVLLAVAALGAILYHYSN